MASEQSTQFLSTQLAAMNAVALEQTLQDGVQSPAYAATITTTVSQAETTVVVGTLTGALTIAAPLNPRKGMRLTYCFTQDGTGDRDITWNAVFKKAADPATPAASTKGCTAFVYDGTNWLQQGGALAYA